MLWIVSAHLDDEYATIILGEIRLFGPWLHSDSHGAACDLAHPLLGVAHSLHNGLVHQSGTCRLLLLFCLPQLLVLQNFQNALQKAAFDILKCERLHF
mmetsp:Transcript_5206/g.6345  ORF Transcript_5206/g.6345 Transcript_5206/m.6345 type:complete len:98 (-) Transcript_5206:253-546(-)